MRVEVAIAGTVVALLAGCGEDENNTGTGAAQQSPPPAMDVELTGADGAQIGAVTLSEEGGAVRVAAQLEGLEPGFHGFHIHETGTCDPDAVVEESRRRSAAPRVTTPRGPRTTVSIPATCRPCS